jgi:FlaA1/EpsC-like NDP-sugar epimerase
MGKFKNKLYRFMYGRYGSDTLNKTLLIIYAVVVVVYTVLSLFIDSIWFSFFYFLFSISIICVIFFRMFSRNIQKRRRENDKFCGFFKLRKNKFRDRKTHVYKKCPHCKAVLRLPKAKGKHTVICPRCKNRFSVGR